MAIDTASTARRAGRAKSAPERQAHPGRENGAIRSAAEARADYARLERAAHDDAVRVSVPEVARALQDTLGQSLTGLIADVRNVKAVGLWARGKRTPHPETVQRLRHAYQVVQLLRPVEQPPGIRAWFLGLNPLLDDTPPAIALRTDPTGVLKAARAFAFHG